MKEPWPINRLIATKDIVVQPCSISCLLPLPLFRQALFLHSPNHMFTTAMKPASVAVQHSYKASQCSCSEFIQMFHAAGASSLLLSFFPSKSIRPICVEKSNFPCSSLPFAQTLWLLGPSRPAQTGGFCVWRMDWYCYYLRSHVVYKPHVHKYPWPVPGFYSASCS